METNANPAGPRPSGAMEAVLIADPIHAAGLERLGGRYDLLLPGSDPDDAALARVVALVVRTFGVTNALLERMPALRLVAKHGSGIDNIDVPAATRRGVLVASTPGGANSTAVAEGAVTLMLAVLRRVRDMDDLVRTGRFDERWRLQLGDLTGARLGLLGFGQIARVVARICGAGFGMEVAAHDPFVSREDMLAAGVSKVDDLLVLMSRDVISLHVPLSAGTRNLIGERELAAMGPSAILVNTSRGGLVDEAALVRALGTGRIRGAGIDVFEHEPPPADHPLLKLRNVVFSPHMAGVTEGSMRAMALAVAEVVDAVMVGRRPDTLINPEALGGDRR